MECRDVVEILSARADAEASPEEIRAADEHLEACAACRATAERIRALGGAVGRAEGSVSADFRERLFEQLEKEELLPRRRSLFAFSYRWAVVPAMLAAGVLLFLLSPRDASKAPGERSGGSVQVARQAPAGGGASSAVPAAPAVSPEEARNPAGERAPEAVPAPAQVARNAAGPGARGELSAEDKDILANLDLLEAAPDFDANGGSGDDIDLLLPAAKDRG